MKVNQNIRSHPTPNCGSDHAPCPYEALIGIDWGDKEHAFRMKTADGKLESGNLVHSSKKLLEWLSGLEMRFCSAPVAVAIEAQSLPVMAVLRQFSFITVFMINPVTSKRLRTAFTPSGAKDDLPDAEVLLELLISHRDRLRPVPQPGSAQTRLLNSLCRERREMVDQRTKWGLQIQSAAKAYYPQALDLLPNELFRPVVKKFFNRWPNLFAIKKARPGILRKFYTRNGYRNSRFIEERVQIIKNAMSIETDLDRIAEFTRRVNNLLERIELANKQINDLDQQIQDVFKKHENWKFFKELPGAGPALAPRLLCAIELAPEKTSEGIQRYYGTAPVKEKSGSRFWTHRRRNVPRFHHQTWIEWAGLSVQHSKWAKAYYEQGKARGKGRYTILRALAFKWMRIITRCLETDQAYNEGQYIQALKRQGSPLAQSLS